MNDLEAWKDPEVAKELAKAIRQENKRGDTKRKRLENLARQLLERVDLIADEIEDGITLQLMEDTAHAVLQYLGKEEESIPGT